MITILKSRHSCHHYYADECWVVCYLCDKVTCIGLVVTSALSCLESICQTVFYLALEKSPIQVYVVSFIQLRSVLAI